GNASRCIGKYLHDKGITDKTEIRLLTLSGIKVLKLHLAADGTTDSVTVDMLEPVLSCKQQLATADGSMTEGEIAACGRTFSGTFVSMGNPHFVIFTDNLDGIDIARYGADLERNPVFPERCNIEFAEVRADGKIRTRVWERGSGITLACGTGACATAVAAALTGRAGRQSTIVMDGGELKIEWNETDNHVYKTGPATFVFDGEVELP
ncbi:MAG: diaminopimelate epimerase, partial [Prevotella sp.]